jgi:hypothetical protein
MRPDYWKRLAGAAQPARADLPAEMPFGFDTRVLSEWRSAPEAKDPLPWAGLLRGALVCASVIMLLSVAMNYHTLKEREPGSVAIADSALRLSMLP